MPQESRFFLSFSFDRHEERKPDDIWFEEHDDVIQETSDEYESAEEPEKENLDLEPEDEDVSYFLLSWGDWLKVHPIFHDFLISLN